MRIGFLCSGLEPGRDGVGDYTRTLARYCATADHEVRLASVRDSFALEKTQPASDEFRLRDIFQNPTQAHELAAWLKDFKPDWLSVQFTPFGFHSRGLGGQRATYLRELLPPTARRHIMLHEIWLQPGRDGPWRHQALGWWQRRSVDAWTSSNFKPHLVTTQARLHQARLQSRGVAVELLPLFSSIPVKASTPGEARADVISWLRDKNLAADESAVWIGHFGSFHGGWDFSAFASKIASDPNLAGRRVCFLALGRASTATTTFAEAARKVPTATFQILGELSQERISLAMQACDAAFTGTPWDIIEKSSTVAAWRAMGIPVLVARAGAVAADKLPTWPDQGLFLVENNTPLNLTPFFKRIPGPAFLDPAQTARTFLSTLARVSESKS